MKANDVKKILIKYIRNKIFVFVTTVGFVGSIYTIIPSVKVVVDKYIGLILANLYASVLFVMLIINVALTIIIFTKEKLFIQTNTDISNKMGSIVKAHDDKIAEEYANLDNANKKLIRIANNLECCKNQMTQFFENKETCGIISIAARKKYTNDFYIDMFKNAEKVLVVSGHSLNETINEERACDLRSAFKEAILRVVKNKGTVKILTYSGISDTQKRQQLVSFIVELKEDIQALIDTEEISGTLRDVFSTSLMIKETSFLPYYIVKNEETTIIAQYKMNKENKEIYIFQVNSGTGYGKCYIEDFNYVFDKYATYHRQAPDRRKGKMNAKAL